MSAGHGPEAGGVPGHTHTGPGQRPEPYVTEVSPRIFAYVQPDGGWGLNNCGFLGGQKAVTAIDTCATEARGRLLRAAIERTTGRAPRTLINTHDHGDHTWANFLFPEVTIVGHELCRMAMQRTPLSAWTSLFPDAEWGTIEIEPPFVTFRDTLTVWVDDLKLELLFVGPAHTTNDIVMWIPERKVLFAGDLLFNGCTPFAAGGSLAGQVAALERLQALSAETVVPGHGHPTDARAIDEGLAYGRWVLDLAARGFQAGLTPLEAARQADFGPFGAWLEPDRLVPKLHRAFAELRGEAPGAPIDMRTAWSEMRAFAGGAPLRWLRD